MHNLQIAAQVPQRWAEGSTIALPVQDMTHQHFAVDDVAKREPVVNLGEEVSQLRVVLGLDFPFCKTTKGDGLVVVVAVVSFTPLLSSPSPPSPQPSHLPKKPYISFMASVSWFPRLR
jgi:hypothetical protein